MSEQPILSITLANGELSVTDETVTHNMSWIEYPESADARMDRTEAG
jgi:hypothetical protein